MTDTLPSTTAPAPHDSACGRRPLPADRATARPVEAPGGRRGAGIGEVRLTGGFWGRLQETNAHASLEHALQWVERLGWLANFDRVADGTTGADRPGWEFSDSEVYKLCEALAWEHGRRSDPAVLRILDELTARIARAQKPDGYLNTAFGHPGRPARYSDLESGHELYCTGHLLQAAVAVHRVFGEHPLVDVARRAADEVCTTFGPTARDGLCGHPEIEVGLAELGRALGEPRYSQQASTFLERRGHGRLRPLPLRSAAYFQDDVPVREADVWRGHAVRALYLSAAAVDVAVDTGDAELLDAVQRQWTRSVARRTYLTGGMGSRHQDEGFGEDWELPPDRAYCETCAGIASCMVSWRLYLATGEVRYVDLIERTWYNVLATSPRSDGRAFFYANPLQQRVAGTEVSGDVENPRAEGGVRAPWFDVSCCPTNVARTLASWHTGLASVERVTHSEDQDVVTLLHYAPAEVELRLSDDQLLCLRVETEYPFSGDVHVRVSAAPAAGVTLRMRVPNWAQGALLRRDGSTREVLTGWVDVHDVRAGDQLVLQLPVGPRLTHPDPRIDAVRGCVAVERGPVVLCLESVDLPAGWCLDDMTIDLTQPLGDDGRGAIVTLERRAGSATEAEGMPYRPLRYSAASVDRERVRLHPYHGWAERGPTTMKVFLPTAL
ncbi:glycoside hydrolase family 127 protein [Kineococcus aurantiacus]|uniref:Glycoside hydrolase family 127 protein n=1 Tax=Kineococcus aurantiacus TaxID=37633 RepID=A0A7Y9DR01_9ACTN|nr:beta-L-arabinofuranosidase domain-containing protein [Kineococcus aurantiacus]NYD25078.1 hypothetical protein [Kineococcus aurantiacus]